MLDHVDVSGGGKERCIANPCYRYGCIFREPSSEQSSQSFNIVREFGAIRRAAQFTSALLGIQHRECSGATRPPLVDAFEQHGQLRCR